MAKNSLPPRFKVQKVAPMAVAAQKVAKVGNYRGSPRDRGYDAKWDRLSVAFRKRHPYCLFCAQQGRDTLADLVDHVLPVVDRPDLKHEWKNLAQLCVPCHGVKARYERKAREINSLEILEQWVRIPSSRPTGL